MDLMFLGNRLKKVTSSIGDKLSNLDEEKQNKFIYSDTEPVSSEDGDIWFDLTEYIALTINHGLNGICEPSGVISVKKADSLDIKFTPNEGYEIDKVLANGVDITKYILIDGTGVGTYSFKDIEEDTTIEATYKKTYKFPDNGVTFTKTQPDNEFDTWYSTADATYFIPFDDDPNSFVALKLSSSGPTFNFNGNLNNSSITIYGVYYSNQNTNLENVIELRTAETNQDLFNKIKNKSLDIEFKNNSSGENLTVSFPLLGYTSNLRASIDALVSIDLEDYPGIFQVQNPSIVSVKITTIDDIVLRNTNLKYIDDNLSTNTPIGYIAEDLTDPIAYTNIFTAPQGKISNDIVQNANGDVRIQGLVFYPSENTDWTNTKIYAYFEYNNSGNFTTVGLYPNFSITTYPFNSLTVNGVDDNNHMDGIGPGVHHFASRYAFTTTLDLTSTFSYVEYIILHFE